MTPSKGDLILFHVWEENTERKGVYEFQCETMSINKRSNNSFDLGSRSIKLKDSFSYYDIRNKFLVYLYNNETIEIDLEKVMEENRLNNYKNWNGKGWLNGNYVFQLSHSDDAEDPITIVVEISPNGTLHKINELGDFITKSTEYVVLNDTPIGLEGSQFLTLNSSGSKIAYVFDKENSRAIPVDVPSQASIVNYNSSSVDFITSTTSGVVLSRLSLQDFSTEVVTTFSSPSNVDAIFPAEIVVSDQFSLSRVTNEEFGSELWIYIYDITSPKFLLPTEILNPVNPSNIQKLSGKSHLLFLSDYKPNEKYSSGSAYNTLYYRDNLTNDFKTTDEFDYVYLYKKSGKNVYLYGQKNQSLGVFHYNLDTKEASFFDEDRNISDIFIWKENLIYLINKSLYILSKGKLSEFEVISSKVEITKIIKQVGQRIYFSGYDLEEYKTNDYVFDLENSTLTNYLNEEGQNLNIYDAVAGWDSELFLATSTGLYREDPNENSVIRIDHCKDESVTTKVYKLLMKEDYLYYLCGENLYFYDGDTVVKVSLPNDYVSGFTLAKGPFPYFGSTSNGLVAFNAYDSTSFSKLGQRRIWHLYTQPDGFPMTWTEAETFNTDDISNDLFRDDYVIYDDQLWIAGSDSLYQLKFKMIDIPKISVIPDQTGDGHSDISVFRLRSDNWEVGIYDGNNLSYFDEMSWTDNLINSSASLFQDFSENTNTLSFALTGIRNDNLSGHPTMDIKFPLSQKQRLKINWPFKWDEVSFHLMDDLDGDTQQDFAVSGILLPQSRPQIMIKSGETGDELATFGYPNLFKDPVFSQHTDVDDDGISEISTAGTLRKNGKFQVKITGGSDGNHRIGAYTFPDLWTDQEWVPLTDFNNDGVNDWGMLGRRADDGRWQLIIKNGSQLSGTIRNFAWSSSIEKPIFKLVNDMNNDGIDEVALFGQTTGNKGVWQVKNGQNRNESLIRDGFTFVTEESRPYILRDLNGDKKLEYGYIGKRDGSYWLHVRSGNGDGELDRINLGYLDIWAGPPKLLILDNNDSAPTLMIYGFDYGLNLHMMNIYNEGRWQPENSAPPSFQVYPADW